MSQVGPPALARAGNGSCRVYGGHPGASGGLLGPVIGSNAQKSLCIDMYINSILLFAVDLNMALIFTFLTIFSKFFLGLSASSLQIQMVLV